jgi:hypothetical protein
MGRDGSEPETQQAPAHDTAQARGRYACRMCDEAFRFQHELDKHEREAHPADAPPDAPIGQL